MAVETADGEQGDGMDIAGWAAWDSPEGLADLQITLTEALDDPMSVDGPAYADPRSGAAAASQTLQPAQPPTMQMPWPQEPWPQGAWLRPGVASAVEPVAPQWSVGAPGGSSAGEWIRAMPPPATVAILTAEQTKAIVDAFEGYVSDLEMVKEPMLKPLRLLKHRLRLSFMKNGMRTARWMLQHGGSILKLEDYKEFEMRFGDTVKNMLTDFVAAATKKEPGTHYKVINSRRWRLRQRIYHECQSLCDGKNALLASDKPWSKANGRPMASEWEAVTVGEKITRKDDENKKKYIDELRRLFPALYDCKMLVIYSPPMC